MLIALKTTPKTENKEEKLTTYGGNSSHSIDARWYDFDSDEPNFFAFTISYCILSALQLLELALLDWDRDPRTKTPNVEEYPYESSHCFRF